MNKDDPRKNYWNKEYLEYWRSRVNEAGTGRSKVILDDPNTEDDAVYENIFDRHGFCKGNLLDVGCAWGRMFPLFIGHGLVISGVDISKAMIEVAKEEWQNNIDIKELRESSAEELPFADESFDNLACLAVLDATYQNLALTEFLRVTKPGAHIYITGKNDLYFQNDKEAYAAEVGARKKNHPNFFTDTKQLIQLLQKQGHILEQGYFFLRRGDFAAFKYQHKMPKRFYEYLLVITRSDTYEILPEISDAYSKTFKELNQATKEDKF